MKDLFLYRVYTAATATAPTDTSMIGPFLSAEAAQTYYDEYVVAQLSGDPDVIPDGYFAGPVQISAPLHVPMELLLSTLMGTNQTTFTVVATPDVDGKVFGPFLNQAVSMEYSTVENSVEVTRKQDVANGLSKLLGASAETTPLIYAHNFKVAIPTPYGVSCRIWLGQFLND